MDLKDHFHVTGRRPEELDRCPVSGLLSLSHPVVDRIYLLHVPWALFWALLAAGLAVRATFGGCPRNGRRFLPPPFVAIGSTRSMY